jgi:hypothetical protein
MLNTETWVYILADFALQVLKFGSLRASSKLNMQNSVSIRLQKPVISMSIFKVSLLTGL